MVTAFFDIGTISKGNVDNVRAPDEYRNWMKIFEYVDNPLYVYVDTKENQKAFKDIRKNLRHKTKIILVEKKDVWGFNLKNNISQIFASPFYPKHHPNTINPQYSSAMHAKYGVMKKSIADNAFGAKHFAWLDIGYFRLVVSKIDKPFGIQVPYSFDDRKVAFSRVHEYNNRTLKEIIENNEVWVAGGFFLADTSIMKLWVEDYISYAEKFIELGMISTDQQVIYGMNQPSIYNEAGFPRRRVDVQEYISNVYDGEYEWFYLGYNCTYDI